MIFFVTNLVEDLYNASKPKEGLRPSDAPFAAGKAIFRKHSGQGELCLWSSMRIYVVLPLRLESVKL